MPILYKNNYNKIISYLLPLFIDIYCIVRYYIVISLLQRRGIMYILNFFESLKLLKKEELPDFNCFPKEKAIYYGQYTKEELLKDKVLLDLLPNHESSNYYLAYALINDVYTINYIVIDQYIDYINRLNEEDCQFKRSNLMIRDAAFFEAVWLFDELACLKINPFFEADIKHGYSALSLYKDNGYDQESLLSLFDNNPIKRNIFFAQFFYFVKKYVKHRLSKGKQFVNMRDFEGRIVSTIKDYDNKSPNHYKSFLVTHDDNKEFDDFIQQLNILDKVKETEKKDMLKDDARLINEDEQNDTPEITCLIE